MDNKVFCIGMFKTGTTSLGRAFDVLGYRTMHGPWWPKDRMIVDDWYEKAEEWSKYDDIIKQQTTNFNAFEDYPWMFCYEKCNQWYPKAKFILTLRDYQKVAESEVRWWRKNGVSEEKIPKVEKFMDRYETHKNNVLTYFKDKDNLLQLNITEGDGWEKLCNFLDKDIPSSPFPHLNRTI